MLKLLSCMCLAFAIAILTASCGGGGSAAVVGGDPNRAVPLGEWCASAGKGMCSQLGDRCGDGSAFAQGVAEGCEESFAPGCVGGRDAATPSGGNAARLQQCLSKLEQVPCGELISALAVAPCHLDLPPG